MKAKKKNKFRELELEDVEYSEEEVRASGQWWTKPPEVEMTEIRQEQEQEPPSSSSSSSSNSYPEKEIETQEIQEIQESEEPQEPQETPDAEDEGRQRWNSRIQFFLATIGFAVGVGNVWRFPYLAYRYGGGAFLIPYLVTLLVLALPLFTLELYLGNLCQRGPCSLFLRKIPKTVRFGGVGIASAVTSFFVVCYYNVILTWSLSFFVYSFRDPVPWEQNPDFFYDFVLQRSDSIDETGGLVWQLTLALLIDCIIVFLSVFQGVKWSGRVVMITVTTPYILLVILFIKGLTLEGAGDGIKFYLTPDFEKLADPEIWVAAAGQVFFSLSPAWGVAVTFGSYLPINEPIAKDAIWIAMINSATSIFAGFVVFSVLGHMSWQTGIPVEDVAVGGPELAFVVYPEALSLLPYPYVFSVMFFAMMMLLGIDSAFAIVELLVASLQETKWFRYWRKQVLAAIIVTLSFFGGLIMVTRAGIYWVDLFDHFVPLFSLFTIGFFELICGAWWWPIDKFLKRLEINRGRKIPFQRVWYVLWKFVTPALLLLMLVITFVTEIRIQYGGYPTWAQMIGWGISFVAPFIIALFFMFKKGRPMHKRNQNKNQPQDNTEPPPEDPSLKEEENFEENQ